MTQPSIKKNIAYKTLLVVSNYLISFVTFPYVSRVLGVSNLGLVNFVDNTINYFLIFASMGIGVLGVREIAKIKDDAKKRSKVFSNILGLNLLFTFAVLLVYLLLVCIVPKFEYSSELFFIGASKILFTAFLVEWFYTGMEDFRYITLRSIIVKSIYVCSVFFLITKPEDYKCYFYLNVLLVVVNALINLVHSRKFVSVSVTDMLDTRFFKENITLGIYNIMTSMYLTFNVMYLGLVSDNTQVGYYTTAFKLYTIILGFFSAFTNVMLPRMSTLVGNDNYDDFKLLLKKSFTLIVMISIPVILCSIILAPDIITLLAGSGYEGAVVPMRIIMPVILLVGIAQVLAVQILMPLKKDSVLLKVSILGALVSIIINLSCVKELQTIGSALVMLVSEFVVTVSYIIYIVKKTDYSLPWIEILYSVFLSVPSFLVCLLSIYYFQNVFISLLVAGTGAVFVWFVMVALFKRDTLKFFKL